MKKVKILTMVLIIVLISIVAFIGVYAHVQNRMDNKVKGYDYAMDIEGGRVATYKLSTGSETVIKDSEGKEVSDADSLSDEELTEKGYTKEEKLDNEENTLTVENYRKTKEIIEKRLKEYGVDQYAVRLNEQTGEFTIELEETEGTDTILTNITSSGKFEIIDSETQELLMDNNDIANARVMYGTSSASSVTSSRGTNVYIEIELTSEGKAKLENITSTYVEKEESDSTNTTEENTSNTDSADANETDTNSTDENTTEQNTTEETSESEGQEEKAKTITMKINGQEITTQGFEEPIRTGKIPLSVGNASTDSQTIQDNAKQAANTATLLKTGELPLEYELSGNRYIYTEIFENENNNIVLYIILAIIAVALIVYIIRYKTLGILGAISYIGLVALFTLTIRYANVAVSIDGIIGIIFVCILNYLLVNKLLKLFKDEKSIEKEIINKKLIKEYISYLAVIIPVIIASIVFSFTNWTAIASLGMVTFWGIVTIFIYNIIITNNLFKLKIEG